MDTVSNPNSAVSSEIDDLPPITGGHIPSPFGTPRLIPGFLPQGQSTVIPLAELERRAILSALEHTKGDRAVAAHLLGIGRTTLYRKLKEYQLGG